MGKFVIHSGHAHVFADSAWEAEYNDNRPDPLPPMIFQAHHMDRVIERLDTYLKDANASGKPMVVSINKINFRAPSGYNAWRATQPFYYRVNI